MDTRQGQPPQSAGRANQARGRAAPSRQRVSGGVQRPSGGCPPSCEHTMNPARINPYGVLVPGEQVVLAKGSGYHAIAELAQHPDHGTWAAGLDVAAGSSQPDAFRSLVGPLTRNARHPTRDAAIDAARQAAIRLFQKRAAWPKTGPLALNPTIRRACEQALAQLESARQGELF